MDIGTSADVAERIKRERIARGMSFHRLAEEMGRPEHGSCKIQPSALQRLESGYSDTGKRPKLGVDELAALCRVFGISPDDLMTPIELVGQAQAQRLIEAVVESIQGLWQGASGLYDVARELGALVVTEGGEDVAHYVTNRLGSQAVRPPRGTHPDVVTALRPALMDLLRRGVFSSDPASLERQTLDEAAQLLADVQQLVAEAEKAGDGALIDEMRSRRSAVLRLVQQINDNARKGS